MRSRDKMRIAWFSPLNIGAEKSASVSAYCSDEMLPLLRENFDIDLYHAGFEHYRDFPTYHYLSAFSRHRDNPYDFFFYQLEDLKSSNFIRVHMGLMPGMVWFHDFIFSSFGPEPILNSPWQHVVQKFNNPSRAWPERGDELDQFGPLGFREGAWAVVPVFSSPVALAEYRRNIKAKLQSAAEPSQNGFFVPTPVSPRQPERSGSSTFRIGFCGSPQIEDRAHKLLLALRGIETSYSLHWLIAENERGAAQALLDEFEIRSCTLTAERTPEAWRTLTSTCDCAVHTLFSVYGQPDPYLAMSLMSGLPTVVTRFGTTEYLPENVVFKVEAGDHEAIEIQESLSAIRERKVPDVGERSRAFALELYSTEQVARELSNVFERSAPQLSRFATAWNAFERKSAQDLVTEAPSYMSDAEDWERLVKPVFEEFGWK